MMHGYVNLFQLGYCLVFLLLVDFCSSVDQTSTTFRAVLPTATKGMVIDAGSGGSRLHVYSWKPRKFATVPPPLSYPEGDEKWTARISPGIDIYADSPEKIADHLAPLIDFAIKTLVDYKQQLNDFPIYFYATGGMRELPTTKREIVMDAVRKYLTDDALCPFLFRNDFARVISGEEEAIFSWAATNFLMGTLLPASHGLGIVTDVNSTYGTLDLGGASTQIAYFLPSQDIMEGLYKFQLGSQKQWNVYTKSFLQFGINSARKRHLTGLVDAYLIENHISASNTKQQLPKVPIKSSLKLTNPCFHAGYSENVADSYNVRQVEIAGPELPQANQLSLCMQTLKPLMGQQYNTFCNTVYHGDCSIAGSYQPPLPSGNQGRFIGTSSYGLVWRFLQLPSTASLELIADRASAICQMNFDDILFYYEMNTLRFGDSNHLEGSMPYFCFLSSYMLVLLQDGYRFHSSNQTITVMEEVNGNKVGWALGAILYEINELPWELQLDTVEYHAWGFITLAAIVGFAIGSIAAVLVYREITGMSSSSFYYNRTRNNSNSSSNPQFPTKQHLEAHSCDDVRSMSAADYLKQGALTVDYASADRGGNTTAKLHDPESQQQLLSSTNSSYQNNCGSCGSTSSANNWLPSSSTTDYRSILKHTSKYENLPPSES